MKEHGESICATRSGFAGLSKEGCLAAAVDGIVDEMARDEDSLGKILKRGGIIHFHSQGGGIDDQVGRVKGLPQGRFLQGNRMDDST